MGFSGSVITEVQAFTRRPLPSPPPASFSLTPSSPVANRIWAAHQPAPVCHLSSLLQPGGDGCVIWNEALGWSKWTQLCNGGGYFHFPWWFTRNSAVGMKKKGQLCSWIAGVVNTTPLGNVFSQARQACKPSGEFKLMWVSSWTYLFWCFLYIWNWKETKCVWLNWVSHVFLHSFIHTCWGETLK